MLIDCYFLKSPFSWC